MRAHTSRPAVLLAVVALAAGAGAGAGVAAAAARADDTPAHAPMPPAEAIAAMRVPEGFKVSLFASEPQLARPAALAFDTRGRAWVVQPASAADPAHGQVLICDDTDGDGQADRFTPFVRDLDRPTGLAFARGGVIVACASGVLLLRDTNGDDTADGRETVFAPEAEAPACSLTSLRYGLDNWIWACSAGGKLKAGTRVVELERGLVRFRPDGLEIEQVITTTAPARGVGFDELGNAFCALQSPQHLAFVALPERILRRVRGWSANGHARIADHALTADRDEPPSVTGQAVYTADAFPPAYRNRASFVCEPDRHRVHVDWLEPRGAAFLGKEGGTLVAGAGGLARPVECVVGPDGAVWILDAGTPAAPSARAASRIYRVTYEAGKPRPAPAPGPGQFERASPEQLVAALGHPNLFWRLTAQRLLIERHRPEVVLPLLADCVRGDREGAQAQHALATMAGLGPFPDSVDPWRESLRMAVFHPTARVRRAAIEAMPRLRSYLALLVENRLVLDPEPEVSLAAMRALAELPRSQRAVEQILALYYRPVKIDDPWLKRGMIAAMAPSGAEALKLIASVRPPDDEREAITEATRVLSEHLATAAPPTIGELITALNAADPGLAEASLVGLRAGWPQGTPPPAGQLEADLARLMRRLPVSGKAAAGSLAYHWAIRGKFNEELQSLRNELMRQIADDHRPDAARITAARELVTLNPARVPVSQTFELLPSKMSPALVAGLVDAFSQSTSRRLGDMLMYRWPMVRAGGHRVATELMLRRADWVEGLSGAMAHGFITFRDLSPDQLERLLDFPEPRVARNVRRGLERTGLLPNPDRAKVVADRIELTRVSGDPNRGAAVFEASCAQCHRFGSRGSRVGPDLFAMPEVMKADLLGAILDPNRSVPERYRRHRLVTTDGLILTGILVRESDESVELLDSIALDHVLPRSQVAELKGSDRSLMPEGFEMLSDADLAGLLEFLTTPE